MTLKAVGQQPVQLYAAPAYGKPGITFRITNLDDLNTIYLDTDTTISPSSTPLPPQASAVYDGSTDVWASSLSSTIVLADYAAGSLFYDNPVGVQIALSALGLATAANQLGQNTAIPNNIAITGTPLLHGIVNRLNATSGGSGTITVPAASFAFPFIGSITKPGYLIYVSASTGAATVPYLQVQLNWKDTATGLVTGVEHWYIPASSSGSFLTVGKGPVKGGELAINLQNLDPAVAMTVSLAFFETTHHIARDDWRSDQPLNVPGFTAATCDPFGGLIINQVGSLTAHGSAAFLMPLYAGKLSIYAAMNQAGSIQFNAMSTAGPPGTSYVGNQLGVQPIVAGTPSQFEQDTGRWPIVCAISNGAAVAATYNVTGTILEYAS